MSENKNTPVNGTENIPKWFGPLFIIAGVLPAIFSEPTEGTPMWVALLACSVFVMAGITLTAMSFKIMWVGTIFVPLILIAFAVIGTWIGFAPGERSCMGSVSFFGHESKWLSGCWPFGISAIILWAFIIGGVVCAIKGLLTKKAPPKN